MDCTITGMGSHHYGTDHGIYGIGLLIAIYVGTLLALTPEHRMDNLTVTIQIC